MTRLVVIAGIALAVWVLAGLVMVLLARRLPDGLLKQVVEFLPSCVAAARTLRHDPEVPRRAKVALLVAVVWVASPIDLIPEFLPVIGPLDDVVAVVLLLRYAARSIPRKTMLSAWPTAPRLLERLAASLRDLPDLPGRIAEARSADAPRPVHRTDEQLLRRGRAGSDRSAAP